MRYVQIDFSDLSAFIDKLNVAGKGEFKKALSTFLEGIADEFLRIVEDEIIRAKSVDTRLLLNSFQKNSGDGVYVMNEGDLTVEVGTNVEYASYVNDGHWTNPNGVEMRWIPGYWNGDHFFYQSDAKTGMLLKQRWIEGTYYFDSAIRCIENMLPGLMEAKIQQWMNTYFAAVI